MSDQRAESTDSNDTRDCGHERTYGAKCSRCGCLDHRGDRAVEPIPWLRKPAQVLLWCADCSHCQANALHYMIGEVGMDLFSPQVREAVKAVLDGKPHPISDALRVECLALGTTVEVAGEAWFVADAQFDGVEGEVGSHLHLTLTKTAQNDGAQSGDQA